MGDSSGDETIPDAVTCQSLIDSFAETTGADQALSQYFLQETHWQLKDALSLFNGSSHKESAASLDAPLVVFESAKGDGGSAEATTVPPSRFSLLSWNLDGLDKHNLKKRTKAVAALIQSGCYDIVFLQEVVPDTLTYLQSKLPHYRFLGGDTQGYFCVTLLRSYTVHLDHFSTHAFGNSCMDRAILLVNAHIGDVSLRLLNSHLESTAEFSGARIAQLKEAFQLLTQAQDRQVSILAGDLNLRDKEVTAAGVPESTWDLWEECGNRPECRYTWDLTRNTNKSVPGKFKPRLRFDRAYLHQRQPLVTPRHFGLEGIMKISGTQSFPSDHWGIQIYFHINENCSLGEDAAKALHLDHASEDQDTIVLD